MKRKDRGGAIVEAALLLPWLAFLFIGTLDFGFFAYAAICTQSAARAVAVAGATGHGSTPCVVALGELTGVPNELVGSQTCTAYSSGVTGTTYASACYATVTASGSSDSSCTTQSSCADCSATLDPNSSSIVAVVTYQTVPLVPIPGVLMGKMTITRTAEVKLIP